MMRITRKLGSWGMVILLLTRAPDGTSCWINTCLTKECRRQWRPTADPHVLLLLLLLLWQPPPPSMAGGCLSPTWTCDWSLHVLIRCSNHRTQIEIARERERERERDIDRARERECVRERECPRVRVREGDKRRVLFSLQICNSTKNCRNFTQKGKKKTPPPTKKKTAKLNRKPKKPDIFCHLPVSIWGQKNPA